LEEKLAVMEDKICEMLISVASRFAVIASHQACPVLVRSGRNGMLGR
jgi:hypothetical protein